VLRFYRDKESCVFVRFRAPLHMCDRNSTIGVSS
jgi:hypothetical protein